MILSDIFLTGSLQRKPPMQSISDMSHNQMIWAYGDKPFALDAMISIFSCIGWVFGYWCALPFIVVIIIIIIILMGALCETLFE